MTHYRFPLHALAFPIVNLHKETRMHFLLMLALAQETPTDLLKRVETNLTSQKTMRVESIYDSQSLGPNSRSWHKRTQKLAMQSPTQLRLEFSDGMSDYTVVADGETLTISADHLHEYMRIPITGPILNMKPPGREAFQSLNWLRMAITQFSRLTQRLTKAEFLPDETIDYEGQPVTAKVVRAEYTVPTQGVKLERTFWIDAQRLRILKEHSKAVGTSSLYRPFDEMTSLSEHLHRYPPLEDVSYDFAPPANFAEVDKIEPWMMRTRSGGVSLLSKPAPEFTSRTLNGETLSLSSFKGKLVLLDFWATWCVPCRAQMPDIARLYSQTKDQGLILLGVNDDEMEKTALDYVKEHNYDWTQVHDTKQQIRGKYGVTGIPTLVLIDREGTIVATEVGSGAQTDANIKEALRKQGLIF